MIQDWKEVIHSIFESVLNYSNFSFGALIQHSLKLDTYILIEKRGFCCFYEYLLAF